MINKALKKEMMPVQEPKKRIHNFSEVALGYTEKQAINEANRCLECKHKPCVKGCPVAIDIPRFIKKIKEGKFEEAFWVMNEESSLTAVCGRVCPQETQCEALCVRGIKGEPVAIGRLERFVTDYHYRNLKEGKAKSKSHLEKVAVVGSGPAGLSCAKDLVQKGYDVTIFEALHVPGGVLVYGIPEFRLPKKIVSTEIEALIEQGVKLETNVIIGKTLTIDDLFEDGFRAVFLGTGAGLPRFMNLPGENLNGVFSANEFLTRVNLMKAYHEMSATPIHIASSVAVVGGGNVAMDAARAALRLGSKQVYIVYRRSEAELPARLEEVHHAKEEGIDFKLLENPVRILGDQKGNVRAIELVKMELGEPDQSNRRRPIPIPGSNHTLDVGSVIMAIGTSPNPLITSETKGLEHDKWGCILTTDPFGLTTRQHVYAGGDAVTGSATVILAMGAGKKAARAIDHMLKEERKAHDA
jgi:glutamate synthase (NADPH) small chain